MTFASKLRLALILAAVIPSGLIVLIVSFSISEQIKRIEHHDAQTAVVNFNELLNSAINQTRDDIELILADRQFQLMEMGYRMHDRIDPQYQLPEITLDFFEYVDSSGIVQLSHSRPALVGQKITLPKIDNDRAEAAIAYRYETDIRGPHPAIAITLPTDIGFLVGGIYLDGHFGSLLSDVMRAEIVDIKRRISTDQDIGEFRNLYRYDDRLRAQLIDNPKSEFQLEARFYQLDRSGLFSGFITAVLAIILFALVIVITASLYFSVQTKKQIEALTNGATRVAAGDFNQPISGRSEGEFAEVADSFNHMMRQLRDYRERLIITEKLAAWQSIGRKIAHEVKNPLTPISIAADDIRRSYGENQQDFKEILKNATTTIKKEVERLKRLIDEFSSFARMPAPEVEEVYIQSLLKELEVLYKDEIDQGRLSIKRPANVETILADPNQMLQLLINLVKNGLEAEVDHIMIKLAGESGDIVIIIEDDGPGFPKKLLDDGITPYFSTKAGGSGLGLTICQRIVYDHSGSMKLKNLKEGGAGAQIIITLPQKHA